MDDILISPEIKIREAIKKLSETAKQILLVVDENRKLLGTITDGDIRRAILKGISLDNPVSEIMNGDPKFVYKWESKEKALKLALEHGIKRIPVVDEEKRVVDLIFIEDFLEKEGPKKKENWVVIMAGGKGTRLDPFTKILPKPLIPIGEKTMLELIMEKFAEQGFDKFILTLNYKKEIIKMFIMDNDFPYEIRWVEEEKPLGTAGSLKLVFSEINTPLPVIVTNCDVIVSLDYEKLLEYHENRGSSMTIVGLLESHRIPYGVLNVSENGTLIGIKEKPVHDIIINTGIYVVNSEISDYIGEGENIDMPELAMRLMRNGQKVAVYPYHGEFFDIGRWEVYRKAVSKIVREE